MSLTRYTKIRKVFLNSNSGNSPDSFVNLLLKVACTAKQLVEIFTEARSFPFYTNYTVLPSRCLKSRKSPSFPMLNT